MTDKLPTDWERIEQLYRAGVLSVLGIATSKVPFCAGQVVVPVGQRARLLALVGLLGPAGADGEAGPVVWIGVAGRRRQLRVDVVVAVADGRLRAVDIAGQLAGGAGGGALIQAGLAAQGQFRAGSL